MAKQALLCGVVLCVLAAGVAFAELQGSYFTSATAGEFTTLVTTRLDASVDFDYGTGGPAVPGIGENLFAIRWEGVIRVDAAGIWRFSTVSDDGVRLSIGGVSVIDAWVDQAATERSGEITLAGGEHDFTLDYYENGGGATVQWWWEGPGQPKAVIPPGAFPAPAHGFIARYDADEDPMNGPATFIHHDAQVDLDWSAGAPHPGFAADHFSVRWRGLVEAPGTGDFTFTVASDDGNELWVDGVQLTDDFAGNHPLQEFSGFIALVQGEEYLVDLRYRENAGQAACFLYWEGPGTNGRELVPQSAVTPIDILRVEAVSGADGVTWRRLGAGDSTTLAVVAEGGAGPLTYQWYFDPEGPEPRGLYTGFDANMPSLDFTAVSFGDAGVYQCEVSDGEDIVDSPEFLVEVVASLPVAGGFGLCALSVAGALGGAALFRRRRAGSPACFTGGRAAR